MQEEAACIELLEWSYDKRTDQKEPVRKAANITKPRKQVVGLSINDQYLLKEVYFYTDELVASSCIDGRMNIPRTDLRLVVDERKEFSLFIIAQLDQGRLVHGR